MRFYSFYQLIITVLLLSLLFSPSEANQKNWQAVTIWDAGVKLERVIIGDIISDRKGDEVLVLSGEGHVAVISKTPIGWDSKIIFKHSGELVGAAIADLDEKHKGNEVFVGGEGGTIEMIYPNDLKHSTIFDKGTSIHGLAAGDVMKATAGDELVAVDNSGQTFVIYKDGQNWNWKEIFNDPNRMRDSIIAELDANHPGDEILAVGSSGHAMMIWEEDGNWKHKSIWKSAKGLGRITCGKVGANNKDLKVVIAGDSGEVVLLEREKEGWKGKVIFKDDDQLRGIAIGDVYPLSEGNEIATFGYSKNVFVLYEKDGQWNKILAWTDDDRAHGLACGEFDSSSELEELSAVGYSKKTTKISYAETE